MKILNLYAGIGGNRKFWDKEHLGVDVEITAVELNPQIANIYQDFFPNDKMIVSDAHQYLLEHFEEYDFIWSSPPCPTHSKLNNCFMSVNGYVYPDMTLYQEIIFLKHWFKGKWCVENVKSYYMPLIKPHELASHFYWGNFHIPQLPDVCREHYGGKNKLQELKQFNIEKYSGIDKTKILRNCVEPEVGLHILQASMDKTYDDLFK